MDEKSLSHTSWNCKYHIVLVPKYRRKVIYGKLRKDIGKILRTLCDYNHASEDNMLCITNDGRKIGLDQRLMNPLLPDDPASKLYACVQNVLQIWEDGMEQKLT